MPTPRTTKSKSSITRKVLVAVFLRSQCDSKSRLSRSPVAPYREVDAETERSVVFHPTERIVSHYPAVFWASLL